MPVEDTIEIIDVTQEIDSATMIVNLKINGAVQKTAIDLETLIGTMRTSGATDDAIRQVLMEDLEKGGRIFGSLRTQFRATGDFAVGRMSNIGSISAMSESGVKEYVWQTAGNKICPDCKSRSGRIATWNEWETIGVPQSGFSVCGSHCKCSLVITGTQQAPMKLPV